MLIAGTMQATVSICPLATSPECCEKKHLAAIYDIFSIMSIEAPQLALLDALLVYVQYNYLLSVLSR